MFEFALDALRHVLSFEIVKFGIVGGLCMSVHGTVFVLLHERLAWHYQVSFAAGFLSALGLGFTLQKFWTFDNPGLDNVVEEAILFATQRTIFLLGQAWILQYLIERRQWPKRVAAAAAIVAFGVLSFLATKGIFSLWTSVPFSP